jgi:hypothetical protein
MFKKKILFISSYQTSLSFLHIFLFLVIDSGWGGLRFGKKKEKEKDDVGGNRKKCRTKTKQSDRDTRPQQTHTRIRIHRKNNII